jgi:ketosteroid isomerase-like protein
MAKPVPAEVLDRLRVREAFDCWNRGELDLMLDPYAEDAVFDTSAVFTDTEPARGRENIIRYWKELQETWGGGLRVDPIELIELGDRRVVLDIRLWGKGTRSEVEVDQRFAVLYEVGADAKISRARLLADVATAISIAESE